MTAVIKLKKSETALSKPTTSDLAVGEVAINALDQRLFVRDSNNNIITIGEAGGVRHESSTVTYSVTVASKDATHRYNGTGSGSGYKIDGSFSPTLQLVPGNTYRFDQSDSSNSSHPLRFYYEADKTTSYTTGVTTNGTAGSSGAYTEIAVSDSTPSVLHYQCSAHGYMGNQVVIGTRNLTGFDTGDLGEGSNLYYTDARFDTRFGTKDTDDLSEGSTNLYYTDARFDTRLGTKNTDDLSEGSTNLYHTNARVDARISAASIDDLSDVDTTTASPSVGQALVWDGSQWEPGTVGGSLTIQEEGTNLTTAATTLNFVGSSVTASGTGSTKTITITGSGGSGIALTDLSVGTEATASGDGGLAYNSGTGVFTYTPPTLSGIGGTTDDVTEGSTNLYFTDARIDTHLNTSSASANQVLSWNGSDYAWVAQSGGSGGSGNAFTNFAVSGQSTVQADSSTDTLTLVGAGLNTITTDASTDTITIGTPTGIPFTKEDGTSTSLNLSVEAGTLSTAVQNLYIPFTKEDGTSVTTLVMS
jgi:hypothetical protein